ncbi:aspartate dehydrogenase [Marinobacterium sedimentorum]|uniref:aspartate dehydrogenase n=1 Tax=Marinobacterium sedimentorum TaxID=2927804 RepID=UPI0020C6EC32|nr:aspartate dehydrogenase [Marinobacterium sedimentorum]MCP8687675.1 aspartate dehydrogenase [Marinobacterium sedimentorum]
MKQLMMIGFGAMAREVVALLPEELKLHWLVVPADSVEQVRPQVAAGVQVISEIDACNGTPDLVVECAGQGAIREHAEAVLSRGWDLGVISVGAFADSALLDRLQSAAVAGKAHIHALAGAIAGIDGLAAAKEGGLDEVVYCARKSPKSWKGSPAETLVDLDSITEPRVFYRGTAREAALLFPANANVAATIALAGVGMDDTRVELMADPGIERNQHLIRARGRFGEMKIELSGLPLESNPKTSTLAALSVVRACRHSTSALLI